MANTRSNKQQKVVPRSGSSKAAAVQLPSVLKYPKLLPFATTPSIRDIFCYIIEHYGTDGLSVLVYRQPQIDNVTVICGDWKGNSLDLVTNKPSPLVEIACEFVKKELTKLLQILHGMNIPQAQLYFATTQQGLVLVDMQVAMNKFAGPGMIEGIFGKTYNTQKIKKLEIIDARAVEYLERGTGSYDGDVILKPSRFRMYHDQATNTYHPMYVEVKR